MFTGDIDVCTDFCAGNGAAGGYLIGSAFCGCFAVGRSQDYQLDGYVGIAQVACPVLS